MYRIYILKNYQLPNLIYDHVDLDAHLDPQDGLERLRNHEIRIPLKKMAYKHKHVYCSGITRIEDKLFLADYHDDE